MCVMVRVHKSLANIFSGLDWNKCIHYCLFELNRVVDDLNRMLELLLKKVRVSAQGLTMVFFTCMMNNCNVPF